MIHNGGGFFGSYPKPDTLDTLSEAFLYYGSEKSEYCQRWLETNLMHTLGVWLHCSSLLPFLNPWHELNEPFYRFIGVVKSQYKQNLAIVPKDRIACLQRRLARLYFSSTYLIVRLVRPYFARPNQYAWANRQNTMKDQQTCNRSVAVVSMPRWMKNNPFVYTSFIFLSKTHNDPDFLSNLGF